MDSLFFVAFLLLTLATGVLLADRFLGLANRAVALIGVMVFWLCSLILPVQWMALLELAGVAPFLHAGHLFFWSGLTFAGAAAVWVARRNSSTTHPDENPLRTLPVHVLAGLAVVLAVYAVLVTKAAFTFPNAWDAVAYHYPVALRWLQEGTMRITAATNWRASLVGNNEILDLLVLSAGGQRLLSFVQWPGLLILPPACLLISRRISGSATAGWPVVTAVLLLPMVVNQSVSGYVDVFGTALLFGSLALLLEYVRRIRHGDQRKGLLIAAGLACGLAVGAKPVFWFYAALLALGASALLVSSSGLTLNALRRISLYLASSAVPCLFWFVRALVCTANPVYPFGLSVGPFSLSGIYPSQITNPDYYLTSVRHWAEWFIYPWTEWKASPGFLGTNYTPGDGLGGVFATFVMPGVAYAIWLAAKRRPHLRWWLATLAVLAIVWWTFLQKVGRFGIPLFAFAVLVATPFFEVLEERATQVYKYLYVAVLLVTAAILVFEPLYSIAQTARHGTWTRAEFLLYPPALDSLKPGSVVLNLGHETLNFALAGDRLTNRVIPSWERPPELSTEFLRSRHVDYAVEKRLADPWGDKVPPVTGLELDAVDFIREGQRLTEWRIWKATGGPGTR